LSLFGLKLSCNWP